MSGMIDARLKQLEISLPEAAVPVANYLPWVVAGNLVFVAGQLPLVNGAPRYVGRVGRDFTVEDGAAAARLCGINLLAQLRAACNGSLDTVRRVVKLGGFVNCADDFTRIPQVVNGASDLMVELFGEPGRHARFAVGAPSLPLGAAVEIDGIFEVA